LAKKSPDDIRGQVVALAGIIQAAQIVNNVSQKGEYSEDHLTPLIAGLFEFDPESAIDVFGGITGIRPGLEQLLEILENQNSPNHRDIIRYFFGMLYLGKNLSKNPDMLSVVSSRLEHAALNKQHFANHINDICHSLSAIYQDTLSSFNFRIQVTGSLLHLQNEKNSDLIRSTLFTGIRAAILWRQCGGRRWKMIFQRKKIAATARALLATL
jgi:high frequency lysogenization protein